MPCLPVWLCCCACPLVTYESHSGRVDWQGISCSVSALLLGICLVLGSWGLGALSDLPLLQLQETCNGLGTRQSLVLPPGLKVCHPPPQTPQSVLRPPSLIGLHHCRVGLSRFFSHQPKAFVPQRKGGRRTQEGLVSSHIAAISLPRLVPRWAHSWGSSPWPGGVHEHPGRHGVKPVRGWDFLCLQVRDVLYSHIVLYLAFSNLFKFFSEFSLSCLYDTQWPLPQRKQVLVSHLFMEVPVIQWQVNWLLCNLGSLMGSRKVNQQIVWYIFVVRVGAGSLHLLHPEQKP